MASAGWARASPGGVGGWDPSLETVDYPHPAPAVSTRSRAQMKRLHPSPLYLRHRGLRAGGGRRPQPGRGLLRPPAAALGSPRVTPRIPANSAPHLGRSLIAGLTVILTSRPIHLNPLPASPPHVLHPPGLSLDSSARV